MDAANSRSDEAHSGRQGTDGPGKAVARALLAAVPASGYVRHFDVCTDAGNRALLHVQGDRTVAAWAFRGPSEMLAARAALLRARAVGLPVADVLATDIDAAAVVTSWLPGDPVTSRSRRRAQRSVGAMLSRLHGLPVTGPAGPWALSVLTETVVAAAWWELYDPAARRAGQGLVAWAEALVADVDVAPTWRLRPGPSTAVLVSGSAVTGLVGPQDLGVGDGAEDLAALAVGDPQLLAGMLGGYRCSKDERARLGRVLPFYLALRSVNRARTNAERAQDTAQVPVLLRHAAALADGANPTDL